jgi:hypothetical protein
LLVQLGRWCARNGIEAEILFYREAVKKIGAESPVFLGVLRTPKKMRPKT